MMMNPLAGLEKTLGKDMVHKIQTCSILCVGAGGIGCELLKNLALSGFRHVEVIDLDTIDVSNLNRQLLFRRQHVGSAKCIVACEVASAMVPPLFPDGVVVAAASNGVNGTINDTPVPPIQYLAHHGNVCDASEFNVPFVQRFDLVLNALDNVEARRRVNRLCLAANVPLVEAGTTGYLGQVTVIHGKSSVACYECTTQEAQKVYPICTIRSTPSMPVHTIVWAKELHKLLFHSKVSESMLYEDPAGGGPSTYMAAVTELRDLLSSASGATPLSSKDGDDDVEKLRAAIHSTLKGLYCTEIQKQLDMGRYKAAKKTPTCLGGDVLEGGLAASTIAPSSTTDIWSVEGAVAVLAACLREAAATTADKGRVLEEFDKDDDLAMRFVTAASNLRSSVFGIEPLQSLYSAKGIAGNIIPAIATTNAICAGLQILQAFAILKKQVDLKRRKEDASSSSPQDLQLGDVCRYVNCIRNRTRNGLFLTASPLEAPNPNCFVCKNAVIPLALNVHEWTLKEFLSRVVKGRLGFGEPTLMLDGDFIWEEGDGADEDDYRGNLLKLLPQLPCGGIQHGTILEIDDNSQNLSIQVAVTHREEWEGDEIPDFPFVVGDLPAKKNEEGDGDKKPPAVDTDASRAEGGVAAAPPASVEEDDDVVWIVDEDEANGDKKDLSVKRGNESSGDGERPAKKARTQEADIIDIDD